MQPLKDSKANSYTAVSYLCVMTLRGDMHSIRILTNGTNWGGITKDYGAPRIDGLKMLDPDHVLLAMNIDPNEEKGRAFSYDWRGQEFITLAAGSEQDAHDVQWQPASSSGDDGDGSSSAGIWRPSASGCILQDAETGGKLESFSLGKLLDDVNHCQALTDTGFLVVNGRASNCFALYNRDTEDVEYVVGGADGTLDLIDLEGNRLPKNSTVFYGQHNLEYFGEGEYLMFDNNFDAARGRFHLGGPSRLLVVKVDTDAGTATLDWELKLEDHTPIYGDNDRLPSGNLLASSWPAVISVEAEFQYDVRMFETTRTAGATRGSEVAWEAFIVGERCADDSPNKGSEGCVRSDGAVPKGWSMYSVERFYEAPLVANVTCDVRRASTTGASDDDDGDDDDDDAWTTTLYFTAWNVFKQQGLHTGTFKVFDHSENGADGDSVAVRGNFGFVAHWRPSVIEVDLSSVAAATGAFTGLLAVENEWGGRSAKHVECDAGR